MMLHRRTLKEVTNGHGGSCGSGFLDLRMREYIKNKFYHFGSINDSAMEHIMDAFVNVIKVSKLLWYPFELWNDLFYVISPSLMVMKITFWSCQLPWDWVI